MNNKLGKSTKVVQRALEKIGLICEVLELPTSTRTAQDAAKTIGCNISQIVKSLVFRTENTSKPILILASGKNMVSEVEIKKYVGESIVKADANFTKNITGFAIGGVPPCGHRTHIALIYIDKDLMSLDEVWAAAGTPNSVFCLKNKDLVAITSGKIISISNLK